MVETNDLVKLAKLIRYYILNMTTKAQSGHATSALSAVDLMSALFFKHLRFDLENPQNPANDRVIFSKGHASPLVWALYTAAGVINEKELDSYRQLGSELEGHPTPRFKYIEAATGSLGQGLSIGLGMAIALRAQVQSSKFKVQSLPKVYVLMGDSEMAEGSVWEAIELASYYSKKSSAYKVANLVGIVDVNRLGQSTETMLGWDVATYKKRLEAFSWETTVIDGHDFDEIERAYEWAARGSDRPKMIIAKTIKGKGVSFLENKEGWHGKALLAQDFEKAIKELGKVDRRLRGKVETPSSKFPVGSSNIKNSSIHYKLPTTNYKIGEMIATRKAYGETLAKLGEIDPAIVALDGEVSNSTYSEIFREKFPKRYFEMFIAEQNMVGVALGMSKRGYIPFVSTFATFFTRAFDQIRMSAYSRANIKFVGSHAGVSIGEDGPSQMGLEDISLFRSVFDSVVLVSSDAVSCAKLIEAAYQKEGLVYLRTARPATPVIYKGSGRFKIGGSQVLLSTKNDKITIVACGICVVEALNAAHELASKRIHARVIDAYSIKPIDEVTIRKAAHETNDLVLTIEDHYPEGGLGDAVLAVFANDTQVRVHKLAVYKMPMSGKSNQLLEYEGISASGIIKKVIEVAG